MPLNELLNDYSRLRKEEVQALAERKARAYALSEDLLAIEKERENVTKSIGQALRSKTDLTKAAQKAKDALKLLDDKEKAILKNAGLPLDYLTLNYHCPICKDTGYEGENRVMLCRCLKKALLEEEIASSKINDTETFKNFDEGIYASEKQLKQMRAIRDTAYGYAKSLPNENELDLVLLGMAGLGKSYLLNAIAYEALCKGITIKKVTAYNLFVEILNSIKEKEDGAKAFIQPQLLLIDDLGSEPTLNNITREYLFIILNERQNGKKNTVIATNLDLSALQDAYGERVVSRIFNADISKALKLQGENLRYAKKQRQ